MPEKHLFEYAVIRVMPRVEREEFMNVGVIVFCPNQRFLQTAYELDAEKLLTFCPDLDLPELEDRLQAFTRICAGGAAGGTIGQLPQAGRFRWLTATRSTVVQTSRVHPGLCDDASQTLDKLLAQLVH